MRRERLVLIAPLFVVGLTLAAALGWALDSAALRQLVPDNSPMQPNTLTALLCLAVGFWCVVRGPRVGARVAWGALLIGAGSLLLSLVAPDATLDVAWTPLLGVHRMAPATSSSLALLAVAVLLVERRRESWWPTQLAMMLALLLSVVVLISYSYGLQNAQRVPFLSTMSLPTALCLAALALGLLSFTPQGRFTALFHQPSGTSQLLRRLVLLAAPVPWALGLLALWLERRMGVSSTVAMALVAGGSLALICVAIINVGAVAARRERDLGITLDSIGDAVLVTDARGCVQRLNPVAEALTGWSLTEARGKPVEEVFRIINEGTRATVESPVARVLREGVVVGLANHTLLLHRDGSERPIADSGAPVRDPQGTLHGVVLVFRDMTEEARALHQLEALNAALQRVMESTPVGLAATRNGVGVYANPAALALYGLERLDRFVGTDLFTFVRPEARAALRQRHLRWREGELPAPLRIELLRPDGSTLIVDSQPLVSDLSWNGQSVQLAMLQPLEARESLERRAVRQSTFALAGAEFSRELMNARLDLDRVLDTLTRLVAEDEAALAFVRLYAPDGAGLLPVSSVNSRRPEYRPIIDFLSSAAPLTNFTREAMASTQPRSFTASELRGVVPASLLAVLETLPPFACAVATMRAQGRTIGLLVVGRPEAQRFEADELGHLQDLADRGAQAVVNAQLYEETAAALARAEETQERLKAAEAQLRHSQKQEALGRLAGGVAHDFNNLLSVILSLSDLLLTGRAPEDPERGDLEDIRSAGQRAAELTRQLLAFSRKQVMQLKPLSVNAVVTDNRDIIVRLLGEDVRLHLELADALPPVQGDAALLSQVLINLAVNARDAMPTGGQLTIRTRCVEVSAAEPGELAPGPHVCLEVEDEGTGMSAEVLERVFEPFFTTKPRGKGTGLGLSTSYGIVRQSGGAMRVRSEPGMGTVFTVWLPADAGAVVQPAPPSPPLKVTRGASIFLVEDEEAVREVAQRVLRKAGFQVRVASSAEDALGQLPGLGEVDLLLTDVVMPGRSGRELADELRRARPDLKVLFMSGYTADEVVQRGVFDAHVSLLQKPFTPDTLLRAIEAALTA